MRTQDKQRFAKLAARTVEENTPEGFVFVGSGRTGGLPFGDCLIPREEGKKWDGGDDNNNGFYSDWDYGCNIATWEEKTGLVFSKIVQNKQVESMKEDPYITQFKKLPAPYKEICLYCYREKPYGSRPKNVDDPAKALQEGFEWSETEYGEVFFDEVRNAIMGGKYPEVPNFAYRKVIKGFLSYDVILTSKICEIGSEKITRENILKFAEEVTEFYKNK